MLISTLTSIADDADDPVTLPNSGRTSNIADDSARKQQLFDDELDAADIDEDDELRRLEQGEARTRWLENKVCLIECNMQMLYTVAVHFC